MKKKLSITIGIPTYICGDNLISTLDTIYKKSNIDLVDRVHVVVDGGKLPPIIFQKIKHPKLKVTNFSRRVGQAGRMNDLIAACKTDILILTNDDVVFSKNAISKIIREYKKNRSDLISVGVFPLSPETLLERVLMASANIKRILISMFPDSRTYLTTNGRFVALSKRLYKDVNLPKGLINSDAYLYLYVIKHGFSFSYIKDILCRFREPSTLHEYINQVYKFQSSKIENSKYFDRKFLNKVYKKKIGKYLLANLKGLAKDPFYTLMYFVLFICVRIFNFLGFNDLMYIKNGKWKTDLSTKSI